MLEIIMKGEQVFITFDGQKFYRLAQAINHIHFDLKKHCPKCKEELAVDVISCPHCPLVRPVKNVICPNHALDVDMDTQGFISESWSRPAGYFDEAHPEKVFGQRCTKCGFVNF